MEIKSSCDMCWQDGEQRTPSAGAWTVGIISGEGQRPELKVLDLCEQHAKVLVELHDLLGGVGQQLPFPKTTPAPAPKIAPMAVHRAEGYMRKVLCPVCREPRVRSSLIKHVWVQHRTDERPEPPADCPDCDAEYRGAAGLAAHRRLAHDYDALTEALSGVKGYRVTGRERDL